MAILNKRGRATGKDEPVPLTGERDVEKHYNNVGAINHSDQTPIKFFRGRIIAMALIVSMGGLIFGYDTGQISGFVQMQDFKTRFAGPSGEFSNWMEGLIVGLVSYTVTVS